MKDIKLPKWSYAFVDGSFNPTTNRYGGGCILFDDQNNKFILQSSGIDPRMAKMRNVAGEILAATDAMWFAMRHGLKEFTIFYDYEGIANWVTGKWKARNPQTKQYVSYAEEVKAAGVILHFVHVKGHSGIAGNVEADRLAREAVGLDN